MSKEELEPDEKFLSHNETGFDVAFGLTPLNYNYQQQRFDYAGYLEVKARMIYSITNSAPKTVNLET